MIWKNRKLCLWWQQIWQYPSQPKHDSVIAANFSIFGGVTPISNPKSANSDSFCKKLLFLCLSMYKIIFGYLELRKSVWRKYPSRWIMRSSISILKQRVVKSYADIFCLIQWIISVHNVFSHWQILRILQDL